jgi:hypothetical protein
MPSLHYTFVVSAFLVTTATLACVLHGQTIHPQMQNKITQLV